VVPDRTLAEIGMSVDDQLDVDHDADEQPLAVARTTRRNLLVACDTKVSYVSEEIARRARRGNVR
jgi:hypothetical protein